MKGSGVKKKISAEEDAGVDDVAAEGAADDVAAEGADDVADPPKLADGFYEIETIRNKRLRKGKTQYFVKWRGWPETANTWEPKENLMSCSDYIDAFEESLRPGKHSTGRRGKRKRQQQQSSSAAAADSESPGTVGIVEAPLPMAPLDSPSGKGDGYLGPTNGVEVPTQANENEDVKMNGVEVPTMDADVKMNGVEVPTMDEDVKVGGEVNGKVGGEVNGTPGSQEGKISISFSEEPQKIDDVVQGQSGRRIGSRRRKSGSVKKFTISSIPHESIVQQNETLLPVNGGQESEVHGMENDLNHENKLDISKSLPTITGIVKPMSYSASLVDNARDISLTFVATRSDGKEVVVDNKFLKANNPLLLINFYEQHLRYNPTQ